MISWARLTPSARSVPYSAASRKLSRASSWPVTSRPITPNSTASSHNATAWRPIERSVFTDWTESSSAWANLPWAHAG